MPKIPITLKTPPIDAMFPKTDPAKLSNKIFLPMAIDLAPGRYEWTFLYDLVSDRRWLYEAIGNLESDNVGSIKLFCRFILLLKPEEVLEPLWRLSRSKALAKAGLKGSFMAYVRKSLVRAIERRRAEESYPNHWSTLPMEPTADEIQSARDLLNCVRSVCTPRQKQIVNLGLEGFTRPEICANLRITPANLRNHLKQLRKNLKKS